MGLAQLVPSTIKAGRCKKQAYDVHCTCTYSDYHLYNVHAPTHAYMCATDTQSEGDMPASEIITITYKSVFTCIPSTHVTVSVSVLIKVLYTIMMV